MRVEEVDRLYSDLLVVIIGHNPQAPERTMVFSLLFSKPSFVL